MVPRVVLTGGPCAGKTSCLRAIREQLGEQVAAVPEAATLLLGGGFPPPGHGDIACAHDEWIRAFQSAILSIQQTLEDSSARLAPACRTRLIVCDRGILDGAAYWPGGRTDFLQHFGLDLEHCFARYQCVIHLQSLAETQPHLYGPEGNAIRYENLADALRVEAAVRAAWKGHPGLIVVAAEMDLHAKIACVLQQLRSLMARS